MRTDRSTALHHAALPALLLALLDTAGCTVGPRYTPPAATLMPLHGAFAADARVATEPAPPLDVWWTGFKDPLLVRLVQQALAQNLDLEASLGRLESARAQARAAGAQRLPAAELEAQAARIHQSLDSPIGAIGSHLPGYSRDQSLYDLGAAASWELDLAGGLRRTQESAAAAAQAAEAERLGVRVSVAAETADAYLAIRGLQARLQLAEAQTATEAQLLDLVRWRLQAGAASPREVAQAEALLAQARATLAPLRQDLDAQENRLDVLLARQPGEGRTELGVPAPIPRAPAVSASSQELLRRRPDVIAAERHLAAASARIGAAVAEYYPRVSLSALLGVESLTGAQLFTAAGFQPQAAAGLRWRLLDFGRVDAEVAAARGEEHQALARYRQTVLRAAEDVENALSALVHSESESRELAMEVAALERARQASEEDYKAGANALTDVLDADRELLGARDALARSQAAGARAAVAVFRALGGGW